MTINFLNDLKKRPTVLWMMLVLILLMLAEIFFLKKTSDFVFVILTVSWFWVNKRFKIDARVAVVVGISFLFFCAFFMFFNEYLAMRLGVWAFLLLLCGSVLTLLQEKEIKS